MLIRIVKSGPGCVMQPGSIMRINDKRAKHLISIGYAVSADEAVRIVTKSEVRPSQIKTVKFLPPRYICGCGMVFKSSEELKEHKAEC